MKKLLFLLPVAALVWACGGSGGAGITGTGKLTTFADSASYAQGLMMGQQIAKMQPDGEDPIFNSASMKMGMDAGLSGSDALFTEEQMMAVLGDFQKNLQAASMKKAQEEGIANRAIGAAFLEENGKKEGVVTTASGLQYKILTPGTGTSPTTTDKVEVDYEGRLIDGKVFDSSYKKGKPAQFLVTQVIKGWTEAIQLMKEGAKYQLYIPADLGYGDQGSPPDIKPGATLIFDVELLKVNP